MRAEGFGISESINQALDGAGILSFKTPEEAARAMGTLVKYAQIRKTKTFTTPQKKGAVSQEDTEKSR